MHRRALTSVWVACLIATAATGCGSVSVRKLRPGPARELARATSSFVASPADGWLDRAEAAYEAGRAEEEAREWNRAADLYLDAVGDAGRVLEDPTSEQGGTSAGTRAEDAQVLSNAATARFFRLTSGRTMRLDDSWRAALAARGVRVTIRRDEAVWDPESFDLLKFSADFEVLGLEHQYCVDGLGVPLVAIRRAHLKDLFRREGPDKFLMPRQVYPVTAVLRVTRLRDPRSGLGPEASLELHDPLRYRRVTLAAGRTAPMAADLSTPLAYHLAHSPLPLLEQVGLLQPQWLERLAGLYMLQPYRPGKIPVVLIHGVWSSPRAWLQALNELRGDPAIRDRYQFWLFLYPTGNPVMASAATLREALTEIRQTIDPQAADPALNQMVLVGHSMGGLLAKMMLQDSGEALWGLVSSRPFADLRATPQQRDLLKRLYFFKPQPSVRRVVFISTPHRGSDLTDQFIGRMVDRLIRLPSSVRATYRALLKQNSADFFAASMRDGLPSSVDNLSRNNTLLMTLQRLPFAAGVPYHSIIGQKEPGPVEDGSDGIVPYVSAHLDGAASELVVPSNHSAQNQPDAIREIRRILMVHLARVDRERAYPLDPELHLLREHALTLPTAEAVTMRRRGFLPMGLGRTEGSIFGLPIHRPSPAEPTSGPQGNGLLGSKLKFW